MKTKPNICFHPEGHFKGEELKEFKKQQKIEKAIEKAFEILESAGTKLLVKSLKNGDLSFKIKR